MADNFVVTPWEVEGKVDYDKLVKEFGTNKINEEQKEKLKKITKDLHLFLRRGIVFSHRDLDLVLNDYNSGRGFFLYTGRGPSGKMHIGHLSAFIFTKWLQDKFDVNLYIQITDDEKFWFKKDKTLEEIETQAEEDILQIAALGFDPEKTFIFRNTEYIKNMYRQIAKISKKINFSDAKAVFGFDNATNVGSIFWPGIQIAPTMFEKKRVLIPGAIDQDNYWRLQRDIAQSLGYHKAAAIHGKFIPSLTGPEGKMSSSRSETSIYLDDDPKTVRNKVMRYAFSGGQTTVEEHRKKGGNPDVDTAFQWLYTLFEEDDKKIKQMETDYRAGKILSGEMKEMLVEKLNAFLEEHRKKKERAKNLVEKYKYTGKLAKEMWSKIY